MITVKYFYSACISIATEDVTVLCDPWFTEGAYDGSWYQYPKLENPLDKLGKADVVYISHIHPDHYDPAFLHQYLDRYPETKVVIARFAENFLDKKMTGDGIPHEIADEIVVGATRVRLFPNQIENLDDIDSALAVFRDGHAVVNMNDNLYNQPQIDAIRDYCGNSIDIALLSYTGAGPYPQTYLPEGPELEAAALKKKKDFFARYETMRDALAPKVTIPFAGKYILGGKLHALNPFRGVADAVEVLSFDPRSVVLADGGDASIDTATLTPTATRTTPYDEQTSANYAASTASQPMLYETYFTMPPPCQQS